MRYTGSANGLMCDAVRHLDGKAGNPTLPLGLITRARFSVQWRTSVRRADSHQGLQFIEAVLAGLRVVNAQDAIRLWIDTAKEFGDPVPEPKGRRLVSA
jgi:hypothetical protein